MTAIVIAIISTAICIYALWPLYVFTMAISRAFDAGEVTKPAWILAAPLIFVAIALDVILNYTLFAVLLLDFPRLGESTFSRHLGRLAGQDGWRGRTAIWIDKNLLSPYDPTGKHLR